MKKITKEPQTRKNQNTMKITSLSTLVALGLLSASPILGQMETPAPQPPVPNPPSESSTAPGMDSGEYQKDQHGKDDWKYSDSEFMTKAALGGMAEVKFSEIALGKAEKPAVKEFAQMMITDHARANEELAALAKSKGATLPGQIDAKHQEVADKLSGKSGEDFDQKYVAVMIKDHKKAVALFEKAAQKSEDPAIKSFAEKTLPTLRAHLEKIQSLK